MSPRRRQAARLSLPEPCREAMVRHAEGSFPEECCGILVGREGRVEEVVAAANVAAVRRRRYTVEPRALVDAHRRARESGRTVLGYYHSHPRGDARPSEIDRRDAWPGVSYVILAVAAGRVTELRGWRLDAAGRFREEGWCRA